MRQYLIRRTERESLLYSLFVAAKYRLAKLANVVNVLKRPARIARHLATYECVHLHLGAGSAKFGEAAVSALPGFLNTDILGEVPIDITKPLPFQDEAVDLIFSSHLVEHVYRRQIRHFLRESYRILKPGGKQIIATPSFEKLARALYGEDDPAKQEILAVHQVAMGLDFITPAIALNGMTHINYGHKFLYDFDTITRMAEEAGYSRATRIDDWNLLDEAIAAYLANRSAAFKAETEVFLLLK